MTLCDSLVKLVLIGCHKIGRIQVQSSLIIILYHLTRFNHAQTHAADNLYDYLLFLEIVESCWHTFQLSNIWWAHKSLIYRKKKRTHALTHKWTKLTWALLFQVWWVYEENKKKNVHDYFFLTAIQGKSGHFSSSNGNESHVLKDNKSNGTKWIFRIAKKSMKKSRKM